MNNIISGPWTNGNAPKMTVYKIVTFELHWLAEKLFAARFLSMAESTLRILHRQIFDWRDEWIGMDLDAIRRLEDETKVELDQLRSQGEVRGTTRSSWLF